MKIGCPSGYSTVVLSEEIMGRHPPIPRRDAGQSTQHGGGSRTGSWKHGGYANDACRRRCCTTVLRSGVLEFVFKRFSEDDAIFKDLAHLEEKEERAVVVENPLESVWGALWGLLSADDVEIK